MDKAVAFGNQFIDKIPFTVTASLTLSLLPGCRGLSVSSTAAATQQLTVRDALNMALDEELARDERVSVSLNYR